MNCMRRSLRILGYSFPTQDVKAIGLNCDRSLGPSLAEFFGTSLITACFHCCGTLLEDQHRLKVCRSGLITAGHSFSTQ